jgi:hypothetical protein
MLNSLEELLEADDNRTSSGVQHEADQLILAALSSGIVSLTRLMLVHVCKISTLCPSFLTDKSKLQVLSLVQMDAFLQPAVLLPPD